MTRRGAGDGGREWVVDRMGGDGGGKRGRFTMGAGAGTLLGSIWRRCQEWLTDRLSRWPKPRQR